MNSKTLIFAFLIAISVFSCHSKDSSNDEGGGGQMTLGLMAPTSEDKDFDSERKLIKEGRVEFETQDLAATRKTVFAAIEKYKAYTSSDQEYKSAERINVDLEIRVPAKYFDNLLAEATLGVEHFDNKEIEIKDVTEEFLDVQARLKTKKELENRYIELLKKANSVSEILEVEKEICKLRGEIESVEGRLKYLESRVSFSTLTMTFYQKVEDEKSEGDFKRGFANGWDNLVLFLVLLVNIWPFILILVLILVGSILWHKRKKKS